MSRKTLALLIGLLSVTVVLLGLAINSGNKTSPTVTNPSDTAVNPSPASVAQTTLSMSPASVQMAATGTSSVDVVLSTDTNEVSAVQLEISYDQKVLTAVTLKPGTFFDNPLVLINTNDTKTGRISYALGVSQIAAAHKGTGTVATVTFRKALGATGTQTMLNFLPKTLVSAKGISPSVLKSAVGATILLPVGTTTKNQVTVPVVPVR